MAKALESRDKGKQKSERADPSQEAYLKNLHELHAMLDGRISSVGDAVEVVNKKLTLLIRLLRQTLCLDPPQQKATSTNEYDYQAMQAKVDKHVLEVGLDTVSRMGKHP